jgi:hypothetical protein
MDLKKIEKRLDHYSHKVARCFLDYTGRANDYYKYKNELNKLIKHFLYKNEEGQE